MFPLPLLPDHPLGVWQPVVLQDREALHRAIRCAEHIGQLSLQDIFVSGCKSTAVQITKDLIDPVCSSTPPFYLFLWRCLAAPSRQGPIAQEGLCSLQLYGQKTLKEKSSPSTTCQVQLLYMCSWCCVAPECRNWTSVVARRLLDTVFVFFKHLKYWHANYASAFRTLNACGASTVIVGFQPVVFTE